MVQGPAGHTVTGSPYLSIVVAGRNDNYGGDFLNRLQVCLDVLSQFCAACGLDAELLIVEWNPPVDRPSLLDAVRWSYLTPAIRIITVPKEIHDTLENSQRMPMYEYLAKNVGVRRARGEFVLVTNPDIIFSRELIEFAAAGKLRTGCFYRADRHDVDEIIPPLGDAARVLSFCARKTARVQPLGCTLSRQAYGKKGQGQALDQAGTVVDRLEEIHTNASGDFLLMAREHWFGLRAYPELKTHSHIDSYLCAIAAASSLRQVQLAAPFAIYHQEHDRSQHATRPMTDLGWLDAACREMLASHTTKIDNPENWGLADHDLHETPIRADHLRAPPAPDGSISLRGMMEKLGALIRTPRT